MTDHTTNDSRIVHLFTEETRDDLRKLADEGAGMLDNVRDYCSRARVALAQDVELPLGLRCAIDEQHRELSAVLTHLTIATAAAAGIELR